MSSTTSWPALVTLAAILLGAMYKFLLSKPYRDQVDVALAASDPANRRTVAASDRLAAELPSKVFFRSHPTFLASIRSYWSSQERAIIPHCIVKPAHARDVSKAIRILSDEFVKDTSHGAPALHFAVRSGGHAPNANSANTQGGITIDLSCLKDIHLSADRTTTTFGPAARWVDVYNKLDPLGLTVSGGRASDVGVAGLILGGGISFFSPRTGFVCDSIKEFEVVLANGDIRIANDSTNRDLCIALRGGGNNFGIVTKFTAHTFPNTKLWAGYLFHPFSVAPKLIEALHHFCEAQNSDEYGNALLVLAYDAGLGVTAAASIIQYTKAEKRPTILQPFLDVRRFWSTAKFKTLSDATKEVNAKSPPGRRQLFQCTTFENNFEMLQYSLDLFKESLSQIKPIKGIAWALVFHPLPRATTSKGKSNALGIRTDKDLILAQISTSWKRQEDDETVYELASNILGKIEARAKERGLFNLYKYLNYAQERQDPISGYGGENVAMLRRVSAKYDPHGLFQKACVGGFKLPARRDQ